MSREQPSPLARYLCFAYVLLVIYASLHPFSGWRDQGLPPFAFLTAPLPRFISAFDVVANVVGYAPLGFLAVLALYPRLRGGAALAIAVLCALALSLTLESLQLYLPSRRSSNLDLVANIAGGAAGALAGLVASRRLLREQGLQALRDRLFLPGGRTDFGLVLLGLWLLSQLNPETLVFGSGDLRELFQTRSGELHPAELFLRVEAAVAGANTLAVGLLGACLVSRGQPVRLVSVALIVAALAVRSFAFGLLFSSQDILLWATPGVLFGVSAGIVLLLLAAGLPRPAQLTLAGLALMAATAIVNLAPENPYLTAAHSLWQQGQFLNFNGLTRIVSAAWPFAAMAYLMLLATHRERVNL